MTEQRQTTE